VNDGAPPAPHEPGVPGSVLPPCVIDVEASGFGAGSYPIEIGFVLPDGRGVCTLVQPEPGWTHWDPAAERLHAIARDTVVRHGRPAAEVAALLNRELAGLAVYSDAWLHDYTWLGVLFDAADLTPSFRLLHLRELLTEHQAEHLAEAKRLARTALHLERHRASADARVLQLAAMQLRS
jgi:hypothetical protein